MSAMTPVPTEALETLKRMVAVNTPPNTPHPFTGKEWLAAARAVVDATETAKTERLKVDQWLAKANQPSKTEWIGTPMNPNPVDYSVPSVLLDQLRATLPDDPDATFLTPHIVVAARAVLDALSLCNEAMAFGGPCDLYKGHEGFHHASVLDAVQPTAEDEPTCKCGHPKDFHQWAIAEKTHCDFGGACDKNCQQFSPAPAVCPTEAEDDPYAGIREEIRADERQRFEHWRSGVLSVIDDMETATEYGTMPGVRRHVRREWATRLRESLSDPARSVPTTQERIAELLKAHWSAKWMPEGHECRCGEIVGSRLESVEDALAPHLAELIAAAVAGDAREAD